MSSLGRVAYVCTDPGVPVFGRKGSSVHVRSVLAELVRRAEEVHLVAARFDGPAPEGLGAVVVHELPCPRGPTAARERALVGADGVAASVLDGLGDLDLVYQRYALWSCEPLERAAGRGSPSVLEVNAPLLDEQGRHRQLVDADTAADRSLRAVRGATVAFGVSPGVARWARSISGRSVPAVANGVASERFRPSEVAASRHHAELVVGFVGTFRPWHDLDGLVDAVAAVHRAGSTPPLRLLLVGEGPGRERAVARARALGLPVESTGSVDPDAVPGLLARTDIALAVYDGTEAYFSPLKVFEYLAAGVPVVTSAVGGLEHLLHDGREVLLAPLGAHEVLVDHLSFLSRHPEARAAIGRAGRQAVIERHTWAHVVDRILGLLPERETVA